MTKKLHFWEAATEKLNLWHGKGTESWEISLQGERLSAFGAEWEILGGRSDTSAEEKVRKDTEVRNKEEIGVAEFETVRGRGVTECSGDRDQVISHHCVDSRGRGGLLKGHQRGHEGASVWSSKEIVNTRFCDAGALCWPVSRDGESGNSPNKQMNSLKPEWCQSSLNIPR